VYALVALFYFKVGFVQVGYWFGILYFGVSVITSILYILHGMFFKNDNNKTKIITIILKVIQIVSSVIFAIIFINSYNHTVKQSDVITTTMNTIATAGTTSAVGYMQGPAAGVISGISANALTNWNVGNIHIPAIIIISMTELLIKFFERIL
jgi:hypothetical protein